jgi:3-oxoacyl-[acyl-carrier protein] reductase
MNSLHSKIAIVTGASRGIGAGIAKAFGAAGASVVVNYASHPDGAARTVAAIVADGGKAAAVEADVSNAADVHRLFDDATRIFGAPDVVVNNAAIFKFAPIEQVPEADMHRQFEVNVFGTLLVIQEAVRRFGPRGGSIINLSSIGSRNTVPNMVVYSATKGAVDTITLGLSRELGARGIRVNAIAPGAIATEGLREIGLSEEMEQHIVAQTPLGRFGLPEDVARIAVFLASDDAAFVTGERVMASGGWR